MAATPKGRWYPLGVSDAAAEAAAVTAVASLQISKGIDDCYPHILPSTFEGYITPALVISSEGGRIRV